MNSAKIIRILELAAPFFGVNPEELKLAMAILEVLGEEVKK